MRAKITQVVAVNVGAGSAVAIVALDECGQLWTTNTNHIPGGTAGWYDWQKVPPLPEGSLNSSAQFE